ncbi:HCMVUL15, partial [Human betaherpesvirus 5]
QIEIHIPCNVHVSPGWIEANSVTFKRQVELEDLLPRSTAHEEEADKQRTKNTHPSGTVPRRRSMPAPNGPLCALLISTQAFDPSRYLRQHGARCPRKKEERTTRSPVRLRVNIRNRFIPANIPNKIQNTRSLTSIQNLLCAIPHRQPRTQSKNQKHEPQPNVRLLVIGPRTGGRFIRRTASGTATVGDGTDVGVAAFVGAVPRRVPLPQMGAPTAERVARRRSSSDIPFSCRDCESSASWLSSFTPAAALPQRRPPPLPQRLLPRQFPPPPRFPPRCSDAGTIRNTSSTAGGRGRSGPPIPRPATRSSDPSASNPSVDDSAA